MERLRHHHPHAGEPLRDRDQPDPAHVRAGEHPDVARGAAGGPRDALVLGVHRDVLQHDVGLVAADATGQQAGATGGVDHRLHAGLARPGGPGEAQGDPVRIERRVERAVLLAHDDPGALGVAEQHLVERGPRDLVGLRDRGLDRRGEIHVGSGRPVDLREARAPLLHEAGLGHRVVGPEGLQHPVDPRQLRLADVEAGEAIALEQQHAPAASGERGGHAGAAGAPADHRHVEPARVLHLGYRGYPLTGPGFGLILGNVRSMSWR